MYNKDDGNLNKLKKNLKENSRSFIFILGAGMSRAAGLPSWKELSDGLIDYYEQLQSEKTGETEVFLKRLRETQDLWKVFSSLKRKLPELEYNKYITAQLSDKNRDIPYNYKLIWELDVCGVITFNIDKLILDAYSNVYKSSVDFATGKEFYKYNNFPVSNDKFVLFPHGEISNPSSWIFTEEERNNLYKDKNLKNIMSTLLNGKNIVIAGFNPHESSFLSLLADFFIGNRISGYDNYYIGADIIWDDREKLADYGINCISYSPEDEQHSDLTKILESISKYIPKDTEFPSVYEGKKYTLEDIPPFEECSQMDLDRLRDILNGNIANILSADKVPTKEQLDMLQKFYKEYSDQLYMAWFVNPDSKRGRKLHGYTLQRSVVRGAFGNVYEAYDDKGEKFAVKILLPEVKDKVQYLSCFRRGIRSMKMLKEHHIEGMVKIYSSYEVPACIVMDYVEGYTLREAIENKALISFHKKVEMLKIIASIIRKSHNLEECILHRDLKPENIMLRNFYNDDDSLDVVILDFDLSWHKGATELTVALGAMSQGFMAPEQAEENEKYTRKTAVDVYSIGMISYYVLTEKNPAPYQHRFHDFRNDLIHDISAEYKTKWMCLAQYLADTIVKATEQEPSERLSLDAYLSNMETALDMILSDEISNTHPLLLQELAVQIDKDAECKFSEYGRSADLRMQSLGKSIHLELNETDRHDVVIHVEIKTLRKGDENRSNTGKYLVNAKNKALSVVDSTLFYKKDGDIGVSEVTVHLTAKLSSVIEHKHIVKMAKNIREVRAKLELQH